MNKEKYFSAKSQSLPLSVFAFDMILCFTIVLLIFFLGSDSLSGIIISNRYIEIISIISFIVGICFILMTLLKYKQFSAISQLSRSYIRIGLVGCTIHLICAFFLFFIAPSFGNLAWWLGPIYRTYSYLHLMNAVLYVILIAYFKRIPVVAITKSQ